MNGGGKPEAKRAPAGSAGEGSRRLVPLGVVTGAHGTRGELRVKLWNPDSELLAECERVVLRGPGELPGRELLLDGLRPHKDKLLVFLRGIYDREAANALRGAELCVPREALPEPAEDEFYLIDLPGLHVRTPDGRQVGEVEDVVAYPAADVARVRVEGGVVELPLLPPYLVEVRIADGELIADQLEDLEVERG